MVFANTAAVIAYSSQIHAENSRVNEKTPLNQDIESGIFSPYQGSTKEENERNDSWLCAYLLVIGLLFIGLMFIICSTISAVANELENDD